MTRKHFQMIADVVRLTIDDQPTRERVAKAFAELLPSYNPGFKPEKFLDACKRGNE